MQPARICVVIPTFNHLDDCLKPCCESIKRNTTFVQDNKIIKVVVVANGCTDGTEEYVKSLGEHFSLLTFPEAIGYPAAINKGITANPNFDYYSLLNNDAAILDWGKDIWADMLLEPFKKHSNCAISGSLPNYSEAANSDFLIFYNVMISKKAIEDIGLLDEIFTPGGCEDIDYCIRARKKGYEWYCVPENQPSHWHNFRHISNFPCYHAAEKTVSGLKNWNEIFERNCQIVKQRYNDPDKKLDKQSISIIPTYNHLEDCLRPCCESIIKNTVLDDKKEIIVVANGCTDGTKEYVLSLGKNFKLYMFDDPLGYTKATNQGLRVAKGDYLVLLNNDTKLLDWGGKDGWLNLLSKPFDEVEKCGLTGPIKGYSDPADANFLIFFCVMLSRNTLNTVGYLDEIFTPGGGEDTDYCIRAMNKGLEIVQVPYKQATRYDSKYVVGGFPIWHEGEKTVFGLSDWDNIFRRNSDILRNKYNIRWKLSNNCERAVIGKDNYVPPRETTRYKWARENVYGSKILEIGCSSGYGLRFLKDIPGLDYTGLDYDSGVLEYAKQNFGDIPNVKFIQADINKHKFGQYDTIIAFEVLEHIENGREVAQKLKQHCKCLLVSLPYKEVQGLFGAHHKLYRLEEKDFPDFDYCCIDGDGSFRNDLVDRQGLSLLTMKWVSSKLAASNVVVKKKNLPDITCVISTRNRYHSTLPLTILAACNQTHKPKEIIIYDDSDKKLDLRKDPLFAHIVPIMQFNMNWFVIPGECKGQVLNHTKSLQKATFDWIWRLDDDTCPEHDVLEKLASEIKSDVGAIGGIVMQGDKIRDVPSIASNRIEDIFLGLNEQWFLHPNQKPKEVDHLYSSFLYRKAIAEYCSELSVIGHREETILTYEMKRKGFKNILVPSAKTWHLCNPVGGIRTDESRAKNGLKDEQVFYRKLSNWGIKTNDYSFVVLDNGLGDHFAFKSILDKYLEKNKNKKHVFFVCFPEVFEGIENIQLASIADAITYFGDIGKFSLYKWMIDNRWVQGLPAAFRRVFGLPSAGRLKQNTRTFVDDTIVISPFSFKPDHPKSYPYWDDLIPMLKELGCKLVQIGRQGEPKLSNIDDYWFGLSFKELQERISKCRCWISGDNFLQHMCNSMQNIIPGVVIWSVSDPNLFGYDYNKNVLKSTRFFRKDQFEVWPGVEQNKEAFCDAAKVFSVVEKLVKNEPISYTWTEQL